MEEALGTAERRVGRGHSAKPSDGREQVGQARHAVNVTLDECIAPFAAKAGQAGHDLYVTAVQAHPGARLCRVPKVSVRLRRARAVCVKRERMLLEAVQRGWMKWLEAGRRRHSAQPSAGWEGCAFRYLRGTSEGARIKIQNELTAWSRQILQTIAHRHLLQMRCTSHWTVQRAM